MQRLSSRKKKKMGSTGLPQNGHLLYICNRDKRTCMGSPAQQPPSGASGSQTTGSCTAEMPALNQTQELSSKKKALSELLGLPTAPCQRL